MPWNYKIDAELREVEITLSDIEKDKIDKGVFVEKEYTEKQENGEVFYKIYFNSGNVERSVRIVFYLEEEYNSNLYGHPLGHKINDGVFTVF